MVYKLLGIFFYSLLFIWIVLKIINIYLINKNNCKEKYIEIKKEINNNKILKILSRIIIISLIAELLYWVIGIVYGIFFVGVSVVTLGGAAYVDSGGDPSFYFSLGDNLGIYFYIASFMAKYVYAILYMVIIKGIVKNILCYKKLNKNGNNSETKA